MDAACAPSPAQTPPAPPAIAPAPAVPAPAPAPRPAPKPAAPAAPPKPASSLRHPPLTGAQRARPTKTLIANLGLPTVSTTDLTLSIAFPPTIRGRFTGDRLPRHSNNDSKLVYAIGTVLTKGLGIPAPRLLKAVSQHDTFEDLSAALHRTWTTAQAPGPSASSQRAHFLAGLDESISTDSGSAVPLLATPSDEPAHNCHDQWHDFLNPSTDTLASSTSPAGTRHVFRLAFNSHLVAQAVRAHLERHTRLLLPTGSSYLPSDLATMTPWQRTWVTAAARANAIHTVTAIEDYGIRYETTLLSGWTRGPDHLPTSSEGLDYNQLYGDNNRLLAYLARAAPHCFPCPMTTLADGTGSIQFVHEAQYRSELYRLQGATSPHHGITRPLRLDFKQLRRPVAQCCSACGSPGHTAHACTLRAASTDPAPDADKMEADEASLPTDGVVCRLCYSLTHRETCNTLPAQQTCKLCDEPGHTSFRCPRYKTSWVPLSIPPSTRPPNPRPAALIAHQRGLAPPSWSTVAAGTARPLSSHQPLPHLADANAFPALPGVVPASPTNSTASSPSPHPTSPPSPASPAAQPSAAVVELKTAVASLQATLLSMQASHQQSLQAMQASMQASLEASNQRFEQRLGDLLSFLGLLKHLPAPALPAGLSTPDPDAALTAAALPTSRPLTPVYMQGLEHKAPDAVASTPGIASCRRPPEALPSHTFHMGSNPGIAYGVHAASGATVNFGGSPLPPQLAHPPAYSSPSATASSLPLHQ